MLLWTVAIMFAVSGKRSSAQLLQPGLRALPRLRFAHGISAGLIVCIFLLMHLTSHLSALWSVGAERTLLAAFRHVYRAGLVEPVLVGLFMFQLVSGPLLIWQYSRQALDAFRILQIASGAYLLLYIPGHMNSVFIYARAVAGIPTDWGFATGAPTGLWSDAWNIRLVPHYLLGVFFVATHLVLGARIIALGHHMKERTANRLAVMGIALAAILAVSIMAGMLGLHARFSQTPHIRSIGSASIRADSNLLTA
jgi:hypothetical protein